MQVQVYEVARAAGYVVCLDEQYYFARNDGALNLQLLPKDDNIVKLVSILDKLDKVPTRLVVNILEVVRG